MNEMFFAHFHPALCEAIAEGELENVSETDLSRGAMLAARLSDALEGYEPCTFSCAEFNENRLQLTVRHPGTRRGLIYVFEPGGVVKTFFFGYEDDRPSPRSFKEGALPVIDDLDWLAGLDHSLRSNVTAWLSLEPDEPAASGQAGHGAAANNNYAFAA